MITRAEQTRLEVEAGKKKLAELHGRFEPQPEVARSKFLTEVELAKPEPAKETVQEPPKMTIERSKPFGAGEQFAGKTSFDKRAK